MSTPILWVTLTSHVDDENERQVSYVEDELEQALGDEFDIVMGTDKVRLMDADEVVAILAEALGIRPDALNQIVREARETGETGGVVDATDTTRFDEDDDTATQGGENTPERPEDEAATVADAMGGGEDGE